MADGAPSGLPKGFQAIKKAYLCVIYSWNAMYIFRVDATSAIRYHMKTVTMTSRIKTKEKNLTTRENRRNFSMTSRIKTKEKTNEVCIRVHHKQTKTPQEDGAPGKGSIYESISAKNLFYFSSVLTCIDTSLFALRKEILSATKQLESSMNVIKINKKVLVNSRQNCCNLIGLLSEAANVGVLRNWCHKGVAVAAGKLRCSGRIPKLDFLAE